jgi:copper(I)-binding protein
VAVIRSTSRSVLAGLVVVAGAALAGCGSGQISQTALQSPTVDGTSAQVGSIAIRNAALEYPTKGLYPKGSTARLRMVIANDGTSSDTLTSVRSDAAAEVTITPAASASAGATPTLTAPPPSDTATATGTASGTPTGTAEPPDTTATGAGTPSGTASGSASGTAAASATPSATPSPTPTEEPAAQITLPANGFTSFTGDGPTVSLVGLTNQLYPSQPLTITLVFAKAGEVTMTVAVSAPSGQISLAPTVTADTEG